LPRDFLLFFSCGFITILLIGLVIFYPPTTWNFFSILQFFAIVFGIGYLSIDIVAFSISWWFTNAIISENLRYEPIDADNFLEILLEEGLTTEITVKIGQNRLSRIEVRQIDKTIKRRLKHELRHNLQKITYNTLKIWLIAFFALTILLLLGIAAIYLTSTTVWKI
jgi:hypothetical protein